MPNPQIPEQPPQPDSSPEFIKACNSLHEPPVRDRRSGRRWLLPAVGAGLVLAVVAGYCGQIAYRDHHFRKSAATDRCVSTIRTDIQSELHADGLPAPRDAEVAGQAGFTGVDASKTIITEDDVSVLLEKDASAADVLAVWEVAGKVTLANLPANSDPLGSDNSFDCTAIVFKDGSIVAVDNGVVQTDGR